MSEVVVIGGGAAGLAAAIAARVEGASVQLVDAAAGATAMCGGAWDVATPPRSTPYRGAALPIERALEALAQRAPHHPLATLPREAVLAAIRDGHAAVLGALGIHRPLRDEADAEIVVGEAGLARRAALAQRAVLDLAPLAGARIAVAWMRGLRSFDGPFVAASLNEQAVAASDARRFVAVEVELFRRGGDALLLSHELAALLDAHDARARAGAALARALGGAAFDAVLVPPILGVREASVRAFLEGAIGRPVGEAVEALASGAQALRTVHAIDRALERHGVTRRRARVARVEHGAPPRVELEDGDAIEAAAIVLATGKLAGGGVAIERGEPRETVAGLPVHVRGRPLPTHSSAQGRDPMQLFGSDLFAPGDGFTLGVDVGPNLGVRGSSSEHHEIFACGDLLDGAGPHLGTGLGSAVATGWLAGRAAARRACSRGVRRDVPPPKRR